MAFFKKIIQKMKKNQNQISDCESSPKYAQAGNDEHNTTLVQNECVETLGQNLVVASHDSGFSESAMEYALDMAKRMDYRLIALNAIQLKNPLIDSLSSSKEQICRDFEAEALKNVEMFRAMAVEKGLNFNHVVNFNGIDQAIRELSKEYGEIEFVVSENQEEDRVYNRAENENRVTQRLCVYSMT